MILKAAVSEQSDLSFPRIGGGDPEGITRSAAVHDFSPHRRG